MENAAVNPKLSDILALSVRDRLKIMRAIVDSLEAEDDWEDEPMRLTKAQLRELERRRRAYLRNPSAARTWEEVRERIHKRYGLFASPTKRKRS